MPPDRVSLVVYFPSRAVVRLSVNLAACVGGLRRVMGLDSCQFVLHGQLLSDALTFRFYNVKENDAIVVVPEQARGHEVDKWVLLTSDVDAFREKIQFIANENTAREAAKIRDEFMTKMERKPRSFRRLCNAAASAGRPFVYKPIALNAEYDRPAAPATQALPVCWALDETAEESVRVAPSVAVMTRKQEEANSEASVVQP